VVIETDEMVLTVVVMVTETGEMVLTVVVVADVATDNG
jgi:hypothetical protein